MILLAFRWIIQKLSVALPNKIKKVCHLRNKPTKFSIG